LSDCPKCGRPYNTMREAEGAEFYVHAEMDEHFVNRMNVSTCWRLKPRPGTPIAEIKGEQIDAATLQRADQDAE
jgi:hypothetical protein